MNCRTWLLGLVAIATNGPLLGQDTALSFEVADLAAAGQASPVMTDLSGDRALVGHRTPAGMRVIAYRSQGGGTWGADGALAAGAITDFTLNPGVANEAAVVIDGEVRFFVTTRAGIWDPANSPMIPLGETASTMDLQGDRLVVVVDTGEPTFLSRARVYERTSGIWSLAGSLELPTLPGVVLVGTPEIRQVALSGTAVAIAGGNGQVQMHERNADTIGGWGVVRTLDAATLGFAGFGESIALSGNRLAIVAREADGTRGVEIFGKDTGGSNAWGSEGRLFTAPPEVGLISLHADDTRLVVVGYEFVAGSGGFASIPVRAWWFAAGGGPGGWALEQTRVVGEIPPLATAFSSLQNGTRLAAISEDEAIFGNMGLDYAGAAGWGSVFHRRTTGGANAWGFQQRMVGPGIAAGFGESLDFMEGLLAVGMPNDPWLGAETGSVMLWWVLPTGTGEGQVLVPLGRVESPNPQAGERFGASVSVHNGGGWGVVGGAMLVVGAPGRDGSRGAAYVFDVGYGGAGPGKSLSPAGPLIAGDLYGSSVAVRGLDSPTPSGTSMVAVGAPGDDGAAVDAGAVYLYERDFLGPGNWGYRQKISRPSSIGSVAFGRRVALVRAGGDITLFANRPYDGSNAGKIGVFLRNQGGANNWGLENTIDAPAGAPAGFAECIHGSFLTLAVGAPSPDGGNGKAYLFFNNAGNWQPTFEAAGTAADGPSFGSEVAGSLFWLTVGIPSGAGGNGRSAFFGVNGPTFSDWGRLVTSDGESGEKLGRAVAAGAIYSLAAAPGSSAFSTNGGRMRVDRAGSYEVWAKSQGAAMLAQWLPWQDADSDGQSNLAEFALGSDPLQSGSIGQHRFERSSYNPGTGVRASMVWRREAAAYGQQFLDWRVDSSPDLGAWNLAEYHPVADGTAQFRHYLLPEPTPPRYFFRLDPHYPWFTGEQGRITTGGGILD